ncbi:hypothetical protein [Mycolicibacterium pulveris]|uniref:ORC-CDC6 family AAA ATPase n=1 Tax=Mycolicibacterium pulveris TaxID=36813 RepID=UPI003CFA95E8
MAELLPLFETYNAKRMSPTEVARSFVVPSVFRDLAGNDHCYIIGPRGSGKTTLLRMLSGETLMAWQSSEAEAIRRRITYSSIFLPADEMWASQTTPDTAVAAFTAHMLYAFIDTAIYRSSRHDSSGNPIHLPVALSNSQQSSIAQQCIKAWGLQNTSPSFIDIQHALDLIFMRISEGDLPDESPIGRTNAMTLLSMAIRAFNRVLEQPNHQWALLLDEMELAPPEIHEEVLSFVRGGTANIILKISMSPFDRYLHTVGGEGGPVPGHDFQPIYLSGQSRREVHAFTTGLWRESLRDRNLDYVPLSTAMGLTSVGQDVSRGDQNSVRDFLRRVASRDSDFANWLSLRHIDVASLNAMSYNQKSATIRKVYPLLVFRDALVDYKTTGDNRTRPIRRQRKKSLEPFTGVAAVTSALEGNPRWIKIAFSQMLKYYDAKEQSISRGFQYDALIELANRFEALLQVLPTDQSTAHAFTVAELVEVVSKYMHRQHTGRFTADPQNSFIVDAETPLAVVDALAMGLYAGAFVQVRTGRSKAVLSDFRGQRFRLAYLLGLRDYREFPLRLGRPVKLSEVLRQSQKYSSRGRRDARGNPISHPRSAGVRSEQLGFDLK